MGSKIKNRNEMKNTYLFFVLLILLGSIVSCDDDSEGLSTITYYAEIMLEGGTTVTVPLGGSYSEPGYSAIENSEDKTADVVVTDNIDPSTIGLYEVSYSIENSEGYETVATRTVIVAVIDPDAPASGVYNTDVVRTEADGTDPRPRSSSIVFMNEGNDVFYVGGLLGYYYATGYGPAYAMNGRIKFHKDTNTFTLIESHVEGWGDGLEDFQNASYDPETGSLYWEAIYAGADIFAVTCTK